MYRKLGSAEFSREMCKTLFYRNYRFLFKVDKSKSKLTPGGLGEEEDEDEISKRKTIKRGKKGGRNKLVGLFVCLFVVAQMQFSCNIEESLVKI